jgi:hypothetical protein
MRSTGLSREPSLHDFAHALWRSPRRQVSQVLAILAGQVGEGGLVDRVVLAAGDFDLGVDALPAFGLTPRIGNGTRRPDQISGSARGYYNISSNGLNVAVAEATLALEIASIQWWSFGGS